MAKQKFDLSIMDKLALVEEKIAKLSSSNQKFRTSGVFYFGTTKVNLHTLSTSKQIVKLLSNLVMDKQAHDFANTLLNLKEEYMVDTFTFDDVVADFKVRLATITNKEKLDKLEQLRDQYKALISEEGKRKLELEQLNSDLDNL